MAPQPGDAVRVYSKDLNDWVSGVILYTSKQSLQRYPDFYNISYGDGKKGSVKLNENTLWKFEDDDRCQYFWYRWKHLYREVGEKSPRGTRDEG